MTPIDPLSLAATIASILDDLGIRYVIGGSVASSILGEPRSTLDLDLMIEIDERSAGALATRLSPDFYVDRDHVIDCVRRGSSFNAIHFESSMKVDFFPAEELGKRQIDRRQILRVRPDLPALPFYSIEDLLVRKLMWFRSGGESSTRQWRDIVGILKTSGTDLDREYLQREASDLGIETLLDRATNEAG